MRLIVKHAVELGACLSGMAWIFRRLRRHDVLVLAYHNVIPEGSDIRGETSLHIGQEQLHRQLSLLSRTHEFIRPDEIAGPGRGRPRVVITFDDAYLGAVQLGVEVLMDLEVPATLFVPPSCLGGQLFWWDELANAALLDADTREFALSELRGDAAAILAWANRDRESTDAPHWYTTAAEAEIDTALSFDGLTVGSHTWSHRNLTALEEDEVSEELSLPLAWLRERYPARTVEWLSYPYGRWSDGVAQAARRTGYRGAFRIEGGWVMAGGDPHAVPRLNVPAGLSLRGLQLRSSGVNVR